MNIKTIVNNEIRIAAADSDEIVIKDVQSAIDFAMTLQYETDCSRIILNKASVTEEFFQLSTCLAGEILQKFVNYQIRLAIVGDFSHYQSKPLQDFIYESNKGNHVYFVKSEADAILKLSQK